MQNGSDEKMFEGSATMETWQGFVTIRQKGILVFQGDICNNGV